VRNIWSHVRKGGRISQVTLAAAIGVVAGAALVGGVQLAGATTSSGDRAIFEPLNPVRILDTRNGTGTVGGSTAPIGPGGAIDLQVTGAGGVPTDATAVVMNVTYTQATAASFLTVWPSGQPRPTVSNLDTVPGGTQPNLVTVKLGAGGKVSIFNFAGTTHVLADVAGYYRGHNFDDRYYTKAEIDARLNALANRNFDDRYYTKTDIDAQLNALTGANIVDGSLSMSDLGTRSGFGPQTEVLSGPISLPAGGCKAALTANFGASAVGRMVIGTLTDAQGKAVLPNTAAILPSIVISTTQGGAVPNVVVCDTGDAPLTVPTGSVFHWRFIDA
jgi:hypothetical protein